MVLHLVILWGAWVAQLGECPTLELSSGLDLRVMSLGHSGCGAYLKIVIIFEAAL